jgi:hypothetical protein
MDTGLPGPTGTLKDAWESLDFLISFAALEGSLSPATSHPVRALLPSPAGASHQISPDSPFLLKARWRGGHLSPACLGQLSSRPEEPEKVWGRLYPLEPGRLLGSIEGALFRLTLGVSLSGTVRDSPLGDLGWPCAWLKVFGEKCNKSQKATLLWWRASGLPDTAGSITASDGLGFSGLFLHSVRENNAQPHQGFHYKSP